MPVNSEAEEKLGINIQKSNKFITFSCEKEVVELEILLYNEIENLSIMKAVCCGMAGEARSIALDLDQLAAADYRQDDGLFASEISRPPGKEGYHEGLYFL